MSDSFGSVAGTSPGGSGSVPGAGGGGGLILRAEVLRLPTTLEAALTRAVAVSGTVTQQSADGTALIRTPHGEVMLRTAAQLVPDRQVTVHLPPAPTAGAAATPLVRLPLPVQLLVQPNALAAPPPAGSLVTPGAPASGPPAPLPPPGTPPPPAPPSGGPAAPTPTGAAPTPPAAPSVSPGLTAQLIAQSSAPAPPPLGQTASQAAAPAAAPGPQIPTAAPSAPAAPPLPAAAPTATAPPPTAPAPAGSPATPATPPAPPAAPPTVPTALGSPAPTGATPVPPAAPPTAAPGAAAAPPTQPAPPAPPPAATAAPTGTAPPPAQASPAPNVGPALPAEAGLAPRPAAPAQMLSPLVESLATLRPPAPGQTYPALREMLAVLAQSAPAAARQAVAASLPQANQALAATMLFFLAAVRGGDVRGWLGNSATRALEAAGRGELLGRVAAEVGAGNRTVVEGAGGDWRVHPIPLFHHGAVEEIRLFVRQRQDEEQEGDDRWQAGHRFLIDLTLSRLGPLQIDGLVRQKRLALVLRSQGDLPLGMRRDMQVLFADALEAVGYTGALTFQSGREGWVRLAAGRGLGGGPVQA